MLEICKKHKEDIIKLVKTGAIKKYANREETCKNQEEIKAINVIASSFCDYTWHHSKRKNAGELCAPMVYNMETLETCRKWHDCFMCHVYCMYKLMGGETEYV